MKSKLIQFLIALSLLVMPLSVVRADAVTDGLNLIKKPFPQTSLANSPQNAVIQVLNILLYLAAILAVIFVIWGGYLFITSGGNEEAAAKGRKALMYALIGLIVVILSWLIVSVVTNLVINGNISVGSGSGNGNSGGSNNNNGQICPPPGPPC